jgi:hypothetical protein
MKAKVILLSAIIALFIVGCGDTDDDIEDAIIIKPEAGAWEGNDIQFNVSQDGTKICIANSSLENECSISVIARTTGFTMTLYLYSEIEIEDDGSFYITQAGAPSGSLSIEGEFSSETEASGEFTLTDYGTEKVDGSTSWTASPK